METSHEGSDAGLDERESKGRESKGRKGRESNLKRRERNREQGKRREREREKEKRRERKRRRDDSEIKTTVRWNNHERDYTTSYLPLKVPSGQRLLENMQPSYKFLSSEE